MNPVTSNLISASAGTGKTYKLSSRFISLLALGYAPERLIALTFTRNAAGEFKSNILSDLAKGAESPEEAEKLTKRILDTLNGAKEGEVPLCPQGVNVQSLGLGQQKYRELLGDMIRKLSQLNLSTLDSFFSKLVGANCLKLGYPSVEQMDEAVEEKARKAALNAMILESAEENEAALLELFKDVSGEAKNAFAALEKNVISYYEEYRKTQNAEVWGNLEAFGFCDKLTLDMLKAGRDCSTSVVMENIEKILTNSEQTIENLLNAIADSGAKFNKNVEKGCKKLIANLRKGDGELNATTAKWLYDTAANCNEEAELRRVVRQTRDIAVLLPAALKTRDILRFLQQYDKRYQDDVRATGKLVFADMPRLVADKLLNDNVGDAANIAYRLDGQLSHWMLDEFQDTSPEQWRALKVLLSEICYEAGQDADHCCAERSIFVVGDEKQSIYGWRGATPELFNYLSRDDDGWNVLQCTRQNESFRSADAIMGVARVEDGVRYGFVNDLFSHIPGLAPAKRAEFTRHNIAAANKDKVGYVCVEKCVPNDEESDEDVLVTMCERMAETLKEKVKLVEKDLSAAILVRSNKEVHRICRWFQQECPEVPVVSLTDEPLSNSSLLGELFLHFFRWMQHPNSRFDESMILHSPFNVREAGEKNISDTWDRLRKIIDYKGIAASIKELAKHAPSMRKDRAYREWMNEARAFDAKGGSLDEWVLYMSHLATKATAPKRCVHIMTFHKSKGLGYDVVFMPFSSSRPAVSPATLFYKEAIRSKDTEEVLGLLVNPGVKDDGVEASPYRQIVQRRMQALVTEALNVLYVAVTRAKLANYILINTREKSKPKESDSLSLSLSEMFNFAFLQCFEDDKVEWGNPNWADYAAPSTPEDSHEQEIQKPTRTYRRRVSPSKIDEPHAVTEFIIPPAYEEEAAWSEDQSVDAAEFGTAVHALFEQVEWLGEAQPGWLTEPQSAEEKLVAEALQQDHIRALFTQQPGQVVYNEQAIDAIELRKSKDGCEKEVWVSGTLDRLALTFCGNEVVSADIIDFKTDLRRGATPAEQDANLCASHRAQMRSYHDLISRAFNLSPQSVRVTLVSCPRDGSLPRAVPCSV